MEKTPEADVKGMLRLCDQLFHERKYEEALALASSPQAQKSEVNMLPYVLEMQVRNMFALMQFSSALKIVNETLKYIPNLRDFLYRKVECELALAKFDDAKKGIEDLEKKIAEDTEPDLQWKSKVEGLKKRIDSKKNRDLNQIRVYFKEEGGNKTKLDHYLKKLRDLYTYEQDESTVTVRPKSKQPCDGEDPLVEFLPSQLKLSFVTKEKTSFLLDLDLFAPINPTESTWKRDENGLAIILAKKEKGKTWDFLEEQLVEQNQGANKAHLSHTKKKWNQICNEFEEDLDRNRELEGDPAMNMFKQIYKNADDDKKRAMIRSYLTSDGTVL